MYDLCIAQAFTIYFFLKILIFSSCFSVNSMLHKINPLVAFPMLFYPNSCWTPSQNSVLWSAVYLRVSLKFFIIILFYVVYPPTPLFAFNFFAIPFQYFRFVKPCCYLCIPFLLPFDTNKLSLVHAYFSKAMYFCSHMPLAGG